jgi:predicted nucleic acid-binding protein
MGKQTMKITLDTNVMVYFFEGTEPQASKVEKIWRNHEGQKERIVSTVQS